MIAPDDQLSCRVYNVAAMSFTPEMILSEIRKHVPELQIEYKVDDRQKIGITKMYFRLDTHKNELYL